MSLAAERPRTWIASPMDKARIDNWNVLRDTVPCRTCSQEVVRDTLLVSGEQALDLIEFGLAVATGRRRLRPRVGHSVDEARRLIQGDS